MEFQVPPYIMVTQSGLAWGLGNCMDAAFMEAWGSALTVQGSGLCGKAQTSECFVEITELCSVRARSPLELVQTVPFFQVTQWGMASNGTAQPLRWGFRREMGALGSCFIVFPCTPLHPSLSPLGVPVSTLKVPPPGSSSVLGKPGCWSPCSFSSVGSITWTMARECPWSTYHSGFLVMHSTAVIFAIPV